MLKKSMAILLSMVFLLTLCPVTGVFAALPTGAGDLKVTNASPYTTGAGVITVDFNDETPSDTAFCYTGSSDTAHQGSDGNNGTIYDGLFHENGVSSASNTFVTAENADGTQSVMLKARPTTAGQSRLVIYTGVTETVALEYDIIFDNIPESNDWINTGNTSTGLGFGPKSAYDSSNYGMNFFGSLTESVTDIESASTKKTYQIKENKWYTVCMYRDTNDNRVQYLKDAVTGEIYLYSKSGAYSTKQELYLYLMGGLSNNAITDYPIFRIDNVTLTSYKAADYTPSVTGYSINNNAADIEPGSIIAVDFDQPLNTDAVAATFTDAKGNAVTGTVSSECETYCNSRLNVTVPATLAGSTSYTLTLSGANEGGAALSANSITFTTASAGIIKITEDFETNHIGYYDGAWNGTDWTAAATTNDVSPLTMARSVNNTLVYSSEGYNNGHALLMKTSDYVENEQFELNPLHTSINYFPEKNPANSSEYEKLVVTYRFNLKSIDYGTAITIGSKDFTTAGPRIWFGAFDNNSVDYADMAGAITANSNGQPMIAAPGKNGNTIELDHWYNVVWTIDGHSQMFNFIDTENGEVVYSRNFTVSDSVYSDKTGICIVLLRASRDFPDERAFNFNQQTMIDDFTIWRVKPWEEKHKLVLETETATTAADNIVQMSFNQPAMASADMLTLARVTGDNENIPVNIGTPVFTYPDFCTMKIGYTGLRYMTDYALDCSDLKSAGGAGFDEETAVTRVYKFTTGKDAVGLTLIGDISYSNLTKDSQITASLQKDTDGNVDLIAAFYSGNTLLGTAFAKGTSFTADTAKDVTFTLTGDMSAADTVKVFALNSLSGMVPAMTAYTK